MKALGLLLMVIVALGLAIALTFLSVALPHVREIIEALR